MDTIAKPMSKVVRPDDFRAFAELVLYRSSGPGQRDYYAVKQAPLYEKEGQLVRGELRDLTEYDVDTLRNIFNSVGSTFVSGLLPENTLAAKPDGFIWWTPAARRPLLLIDRLEKETGLESGIYNWPPLLFMANAGYRCVYALRENARPSEESEILMPPFWNVTKDGGICFGSARFENSRNAKELMGRMEKAFFDSQFSHVAGNENRFEEGLNLQDAWEEARERAFPVEKVFSCGTVGSLLSEFNF